MAYLYLSRTVHMPTSAVGCEVRNSFGVCIATCRDSFTATAIASLLNIAHPHAIAQEQAHDDAERRFFESVIARNAR